MVIVMRLLNVLEIELEDAGDNATAEFSDTADIADYAADAVSALVANGIITGADNRLNPRGYASRAEIAVIINRILTLVK